MDDNKHEITEKQTLEIQELVFIMKTERRYEKFQSEVILIVTGDSESCRVEATANISPVVDCQQRDVRLAFESIVRIYGQEEGLLRVLKDFECR